ncbi:hypothetical protein OJAV_G00116060 [Oryzias javanicus]|uniref:THD domain-containing protein n=1 Tax=Oryzias javanicus TaxID=123683 RepID=A0A3S2MRI9_ORYJA|nr:hypothetical protein OJAV_G00116060 [Oryzias javanicus]
MGCTDKDMEMCTEESVVLLVKQCRDMRRQEMLFRGATLLLLCFGTALILNSSSFGFGRFTQPNKIESTAEERIPDAGSDCSGKMHIHLTQETIYRDNITWQLAFNACLTFENSSIMIPQSGVYFVYVRFTLTCEHGSTLFSMKVTRWSESYPATTKLMHAQSDLNCTNNYFQTVYAGELLELSQGDQLKVNITQGYDLINESNFGAFSL